MSTPDGLEWIKGGGVVPGDPNSQSPYRSGIKQIFRQIKFMFTVIKTIRVSNQLVWKNLIVETQMKRQLLDHELTVLHLPPYTHLQIWALALSLGGPPWLRLTYNILCTKMLLTKIC